MQEASKEIHRKHSVAAHAPRLPLVAFEVFQFDAQHVILVVRQHVDIFVPEPELLRRIAETVFVVRPIAVEVFARIPEVVAPLDHLSKWNSMKSMFECNDLMALARARRQNRFFFIRFLVILLVFSLNARICTRSEILHQSIKSAAAAAAALIPIDSDSSAFCRLLSFSVDIY